MKKIPSAIRVPLLILFFFEGLTASVGGLLFILRPSGELMHTSPQLLHHSPFSTFLIPGLLLFTMLGTGSIVTALLLINQKTSGLWMGAVTGAGTLIWVVVQLFMIRHFSWLQVLYFITGLMMLILSLAGIAGKRP